MPSPHAIVLPGGGYQMHAPHEADPVAAWLESLGISALGISASVFRYPLNTRHPAPLNAVRAEIAARHQQTPVVGVIGFSAGGHLGGQAALASERGDRGRPDFALLGYAITSMETDTYKPAAMRETSVLSWPRTSSRTESPAPCWLGADGGRKGGIGASSAAARTRRSA